MWESSTNYFMGTRTISDRALPWEESWENPLRKVRFDRRGGEGEDWRKLKNPCYGEIEEIEDELEKRFKLFHNFEVTDYAPLDHRFKDAHQTDKVQKNKHMEGEKQILEKELPGTGVYVRAFRNRPDLMRAVIIGSEGTPYCHGLFFFDIFIPSKYPSQPPEVVYLYHGIEINPYLQRDGKVSLALLSSGFRDRLSLYPAPHKSQRWNPEKSSILEVLLSIQSSVLKDHSLPSLPIPPNGHESLNHNKPVFIELCKSMMHKSQRWNPKKSSILEVLLSIQSSFLKDHSLPSLPIPPNGHESLNHNKPVFIELCKSMMHLLHRPPMGFQVFVAGHFRKRAHSILTMYKEIMGTPDHKDPTSKLFWSLINAFASNGTYCGHHYTPSQLKESTETTSMF